MYKWRLVTSTQSPKLIDTESAKFSVYIRRNVIEHTVNDDEGNAHTEYDYEECKISKDVYESIMATMDDTLAEIKKTRADLDYVTMMVDTEEEM